MVSTYLNGIAQDSAANVVRFAKAAEEEAPHMLQGMRSLSVINLPQAESQIHRVISSWGMTLPVEIDLWNKGIVFCPMVKVQTWFEYLIVRKSKLLLGGFDRRHKAVPNFLTAFWKAYQYEEPDHAVYTHLSHTLHTCVPISLYSDEGRGLRKAPVFCMGMETVFGVGSFAAFQKNSKKTWDDALFWRVMEHTGTGSSLLSRILLYILPHKTYKGKKNRLWQDAFLQVTKSLAEAFNTGVDVDNKRWHLVFISCKGDNPALCKMGRLSRTFMHLTGTSGICFMCRAGQEDLPWEQLTPDAPWRSTCYEQRPWKSSAPPSLVDVPFSPRPERMLRSDLLHLVKLGVARHFLASSVVVLGEWGVFGDSLSIDKILEAAHEDFNWSCSNELHQHPHLKSFTKDLFHMPRRAAYPWGGFLYSKICLPVCYLGIQGYIIFI